ncbi:hypothetical protein [Vibrio cionasavignyae]|uniref:hypothetical protein n=1 Tax=Vibrio cionasavignyae TaxID=2910252 RepID=UPI003D0BE0F1
MCKLDEGYEDLMFEIDDSDIEMLGWDDKEWWFELIVFLVILASATAIALFRVISE